MLSGTGPTGRRILSAGPGIGYWTKTAFSGALPAPARVGVACQSAEAAGRGEAGTLSGAGRGSPGASGAGLVRSGEAGEEGLDAVGEDALAFLARVQEPAG
ncbi:hypothetical protein GCM10023334_033450 [Nonomuraea thailandensis]